VRSSPVIAGDQIVVGSYDDTVYGIDRETGNVRWSLEVGASAATLVVGETVYALSVDGRVVAIGNA
jgi:outer membrane protein assembly factor BamB